MQGRGQIRFWKDAPRDITNVRREVLELALEAGQRMLDDRVLRSHTFGDETTPAREII